MIKQKGTAILVTAALLMTLSGCGRCIKYGDEITEVRGWAGSDGTILYFTQLDYTKISSKNEALDAALNGYIDGVIGDFYRQDDNLAIAKEDYADWDVEYDGREFPTATVKEWEDEEAAGCYYDVIRIIVEADREPYVSLRANRITYSSKNNVGAYVETATFDAKTGARLGLDDIFSAEQKQELNERLTAELRKQYGEGLRDGFEKKVDAYEKGTLAKWYIEGKDFVVLYSQGSVAAQSEGEPEIHVAMPR